MKLKIALCVSVCTILFNSCRDISFSNPLDPNASKEPAKIIRIIDTDVFGDGDIDYDDGKIWKITNAGAIHLLDIESGTRIRSISGISGTGIANKAGELFVCNGENSVKVFDSLAETLVRQIITIDLYPTYCTFIENRFIVHDQRSKGIYEIDIESGTTTRLFETQSIDISGIAVYKDQLAILDRQSDSIYLYHQNGIVSGVFKIPVSGVSGIASDFSQYLYVFNVNGQIFKLTLP